jgi:hypothetical protein
MDYNIIYYYLIMSLFWISFMIWLTKLLIIIQPFLEDEYKDD